MKNLLINLTLLVLLAAPSSAQLFHVVYRFDDPFKGSDPRGLIAEGRDGNMFSTAWAGGNGNGGVVYKITPGGTETRLYSFDTSAGDSPMGGLTLGVDGNFYGSTLNSGTLGGSVFVTDPSGSNLRFLHEFVLGPDGGYLNDAPIQIPSGYIFGVNLQGGSVGCGVVYKISPSGQFTTVFDFGGAKGCGPASLIEGSDGNLYGLALQGRFFSGTIFRITPGGTFTTLYNFQGPDGSVPVSLIQGTDQNFYGVTFGGGAHDSGEVFKLSTQGNLTILHSFDAGSSEGGNFPTGLLQATDGCLYGVAEAGGALGYGTIYKIDRNGQFSVVYTFDSTTGGSLSPLMQHTNGIVYGTTNPTSTFFSLNLGLHPFVSLVSTFGSVGKSIGILGQGFQGTTSVAFNGTPATFVVVSGHYLTATVPADAATGFVTVTTPSGTLTSSKKFHVNTGSTVGLE